MHYATGYQILDPILSHFPALFHPFQQGVFRVSNSRRGLTIEASSSERNVSLRLDCSCIIKCMKCHLHFMGQMKQIPIHESGFAIINVLWPRPKVTRYQWERVSTVVLKLGVKTPLGGGCDLGSE